MSESNNENLPSVPAEWPGAFGIYKYSKQAVRQNLGTLVLLWLLSVVVSAVLRAVLRDVSNLVNFIFDGLVTAAVTLTYIAGVRKQALPFGDALDRGTKFWLQMVGLNLLVGLSIIGSLLLLIVPFFFVAPRLALATYFLVDKDLGMVEAYKASWHATEGHVGKVYGIVGAGIAMMLLMLTIIGIPFSIYFLIMYSAAFTVLYEYVGKSGAKPAAKAKSAA